MHLKRTTHLKFECRVKAPLSTVIAYIQDPLQLVRLSSLSIYIKEHPKKENCYILTHRIPILCGYESTTTFEATLTKQPNGIKADIEAGLGTKLSSEYRVTVLEDGTSQVTEYVEVQALFFTLPYIASTLTNTRPQNMRNLVTRVESPDTEVMELPRNVKR